MKRTLITILALAAVELLTARAQSLPPTLIPKWTNTTVFGANQVYVNGGAYNPTTGNLIVCQCHTPTHLRMPTFGWREHRDP